jgi:hypothetical protein
LSESGDLRSDTRNMALASWFRVIPLQILIALLCALAATASAFAAGAEASSGGLLAHHWLKGLLCAAFLAACGVATRPRSG